MNYGLCASLKESKASQNWSMHDREGRASNTPSALWAHVNSGALGRATSMNRALFWLLLVESVVTVVVGAQANQSIATAQPGKDLGAGVAAAYAQLPPCTDSGGKIFPHCGVITVPPGTYDWSSQQTISSPYVSLLMPGVTINYSGTSTTACALNITSSPFTADAGQPGRYGGPSFVLKGNFSAGICGIRFFDIEGFQFEGTITQFRGTASVGLLQQNVTQHTERSQLNLWLSYDTTGWKQTISPDSGSTTGYGTFDVHCAIGDGETCLSATGLNRSHPLIFADSFVHLICDNNGSGTCLSFTTYSQFRNLFALEMEQSAGHSGIARDFDSTSAFYGLGYILVHQLSDRVPSDQAVYDWHSDANAPSLRIGSRSSIQAGDQDRASLGAFEDFAGAQNVTFTGGNNLGIGARISCAGGMRCTNLSGTVLLTTGSDVSNSSPGALTISFPFPLVAGPTCITSAEGVWPGYQQVKPMVQFPTSQTSVSLLFPSGVLAAKKDYFFTYFCGN